MTKRIITSLVLFLSVLFLPYWVYLPLLFIAIALFPIYWEGIIFALLSDALYGGAFENLGAIFSSLGFYALIVAIVFIPLRERLRYHA